MSLNFPVTVCGYRYVAVAVIVFHLQHYRLDKIKAYQSLAVPSCYLSKSEEKWSGC